MNMFDQELQSQELLVINVKVLDILFIEESSRLLYNRFNVNM